ncbi:DUF2218 domain-containing protein [Nonomuraea angiospora]|uniref:DUF2218 domain-containing protein n=1 Tax=Nonomuraea angiospora TaxID=46172 RepID=UPI0029B6D90B|nr:DUF2218 domain-containing protein [Nonomuraea angiospora]MDX3101920.1 DUF2218 domain-containing protein [Nonomuraea angiospora]
MHRALGLDTTGMDLASQRSALRRPRRPSAGSPRGSFATNALRLAELGESFNAVLGSPMFHIFGDDEQTAYVGSLHVATKPGGRLSRLPPSTTPSSRPRPGPARRAHQNPTPLIKSPKGLPMPTAEARVATERASRYLVQLCRHATQLGHGFPAHPGRNRHMDSERPKNIQAEWSETSGTITVDWGSCVLKATPEALTLSIEAEDEDRLRRLQTLLTRNITRMGRRDNLAVDWNRTDVNAETAPTIGTAPGEKATPRRGRHTVVGLTMAALVAVGVHVGLAAGILTIPHWAGVGADVVLVALLVKAALVATHVWRRRPSAKAR